MGACCGRSESAQQSRQIDRQIEAESRGRNHAVRMLLLGPGDSGKSTVAKQMKILHLNGFTERERAEWKPIVYRNAVFGMRILTRKALEFGYQLQPYNEQNAARLLQKDEAGGLFGGPDIRVDQNNGPILSQLWQDPAIRGKLASFTHFRQPLTPELLSFKSTIRLPIFLRTWNELACRTTYQHKGTCLCPRSRLLESTKSLSTSIV